MSWLCFGSLAVAQPAGGYVYWTDTQDDKIYRCRMDGSEQSVVISDGLSHTEDIEIDPFEGKIYWSDSNTDNVRRANLDGTGVQTIQSSPQINHIALDLAAGKVYSTDSVLHTIRRSNLDGSAAETFRSTSTDPLCPMAIAIDALGGKIYWSERFKLYRSDLDGTKLQTIISGGTAIHSITVEPILKRLYFIVVAPGPWSSLVSATLTGGDRRTLFTVNDSSFAQGDVEIDRINRKVYWTAPSRSMIFRANLDGSGREAFQATGTRLQGLSIFSGSLRVLPIAHGTQIDSGGVLTAGFGYLNLNAFRVAAPIGSENRIHPGAQGQGQSKLLLPGYHPNQFAVPFSGEPPVWALLGCATGGSDGNLNGISDECEDDWDGDGVYDDGDNCPGIANPDQADSDGDGNGDACDICPGFIDDFDADGDGVPDGCDACPGVDDTVDADGDGTPDACDICPGFDDTLDWDQDGVPDGCDVCPGFDDALDWDQDGVPDGCDVCPGFDDALDTDQDGVSDGCDVCALDYDSDQTDSDGDGVGDACDQCPGFDDTLDGDDDGVPDACDVCPGFDDALDTDQDGVSDGCDVCALDYDPDQTDSDGDGVGDACDQCPGFDDLADTDGDHIPDACDPCPESYGSHDYDFDGIPDGCDVCAFDFDPEQPDSDGDGVGDACDHCPGFDDSIDVNNNGYPDGCEPCTVEFDDVVFDPISPNLGKFGMAVCLRRGVAIVGSPGSENQSCPSSSNCVPGRAFVYRLCNGSWLLEQVLVPFESAKFDRFGSSVAVDGNLAVISSSRESAAYIFEFDGQHWVQRARESISGGSPIYAVGISGRRIAMGVPSGSNSDGTRGFVDIYEEVEGSWAAVHRLTSHLAELSAFGEALAIEGDKIVIGSPNERDPATNRLGAIYVYEYDGEAWNRVLRFRPPYTAGFRFGQALAIRGDVILAGNFDELVVTPPPGSQSYGSAGAAYFLRRSETGAWNLESRVTEPKPGSGRYFGSHVALDNDIALIGTGISTGQPLLVAETHVYVRDGTGWYSKGKLHSAMRHETPISGSVSMDGSHAVVGVVNSVGNPNWDSAVFVDELGDCNGNGIIDACESPQPAPCTPALPGDVNGDGLVSLDDVAPFVARLLCGAGPVDSPSPPDVNEDGRVDGADISVFMGLLAPN